MSGATAADRAGLKDAGLRLLLLLALLAVIARLQVLRTGLGSGVLLAAGALLLTGIFAGKVAAGIGLPRLTGYLLIGVAVGPHALRFIPGEGVDGLELVKGLAVSLIALTAGTELRLGLIRRLGRKVARLGALTSLVVMIVSMAGTLAMRRWLPFLAEMTWPQAVAVAALLSAVVVSFSPTVTIAILQETRAKGPFSEFLLALVIIGDLIVMLAFAVATGVVKAVFGGPFDLGVLAGGVGWELFGSVIIGALIGLGALLYLKRVGREVPLFISGLCFALAETGVFLHLSPLLLALSAGAVIANLDEREANRLHHAVEQAGLPVFAVFFAAAGAALHLDVLRTVGPVALVLALLRGGALYVSVRKFAPPDEPHVRRGLWMGLISQAGVTFGLAALVESTFPTFGAAAATLIIAMVTLHELVGPLLTRRALAQAGEIRADGAGPV